MAASGARRSSERRSEHLLNDLLDTQGWDRRRPPLGDVLFQQEYRSHPELALLLRGASKSGVGFGVPEALIVERSSRAPLAVIEAKARPADIEIALAEAEAYALPLVNAGYHPLAIGLAGSDSDFVLRVAKWSGSAWVTVTYDGSAIGWIPNRADISRISAPSQTAELRPSIPSPEVLAIKADEINRLLRESNIKDEFRPAVVAAIMLALWQAGRSGREIRRNSADILKDINAFCREAFIAAGKAALANSIRVDQANVKLAENARRITNILERLNVAVLTAEHDYLGQLYETFFRYTGGNTIGQYFTPRHIARAMVELCEVGKNDIVLDPACGSGGFLIASMDRMLREHGLKREQMVSVVAQQLIGFESEPVTAALAVANMILRGDGSTGIHQADAFSSPAYPVGMATVALLNPPFPHKQTDTPAEDFVERALDGLAPKGRLAAILPTSILVKRSKGEWRERILNGNRLLAVCQLPDELFQPFAAATTSIVLFQKGTRHSSKTKTVFVRLNHDGLVLRKSARLPRPNEPDETPLAIDAITNKVIKAGFSGTAAISGQDEWAAGAYIDSSEPTFADANVQVDLLQRRLASFYTRYAPEILEQREAIADGDIAMVGYRDILSKSKLTNAAAIKADEKQLGSLFDIYYGLGEIESREGIPNGKALIVSPTEQYNGCYGWLDFHTVLEPPFITVARTGSIGEAFVHLEPCAPNSDCLVLLPRKGTRSDIPYLLLCASAIRAEKWRYNYGRKITPSRIASINLNFGDELSSATTQMWAAFENVIEASLTPYRDRYSSVADPNPSDNLAEDEEDLRDALAAIVEESATDWTAAKVARGL
jgi:type I restriction enzyme M protein